MSSNDETLQNFIVRRQRELSQQIAALELEVRKRRIELDDIQRLLPTLRVTRDEGGVVEGPIDKPVQKISSAEEVATHTTQTGNAGDAILAFQIMEKRLQRGVKNVAEQYAEAAERYPFLEYENLTIKELLVKALTDHFQQGATVVDLVEFIKNAYGRTIDRSSLSPQLSRLKQDGSVEQLQDSTWDLTKERRLGLRMYDHPSSQKAMTESLRKD